MDGARLLPVGKALSAGSTRVSLGSMHTVPGALRGLPRLAADGVEANDVGHPTPRIGLYGSSHRGRMRSSPSRVAKAAMQSAPTFNPSQDSWA